MEDPQDARVYHDLAVTAHRMGYAPLARMLLTHLTAWGDGEGRPAEPALRARELLAILEPGRGSPERTAGAAKGVGQE